MPPTPTQIHVVTEFKVRKARNDLMALRSLQTSVNMEMTALAEANLVTGPVVAVVVLVPLVVVVAVLPVQITSVAQVAQV